MGVSDSEAEEEVDWVEAEGGGLSGEVG